MAGAVVLCSVYRAGLNRLGQGMGSYHMDRMSEPTYGKHEEYIHWYVCMYCTVLNPRQQEGIMNEYKTDKLPLSYQLSLSLMCIYLLFRQSLVCPLHTRQSNFAHLQGTTCYDEIIKVFHIECSLPKSLTHCIEFDSFALGILRVSFSNLSDEFITRSACLFYLHDSFPYPTLLSSYF